MGGGGSLLRGLRDGKVKTKPELSYLGACVLSRYWCLDTTFNSLHGSAARQQTSLQCNPGIGLMA